MKAMHVVEAALFSAGRPVSVEEIAEQANMSAQAVTKAVKELAASYDERDTVLEIGKAGTKWAMQVRRKAAEPAARFAPMEVPKKVLKTLALIAYHQPMKQSDLKEMVGSKVYDHVAELKERGLVKSRRDGNTKILTTTASFPEYFGLEGSTPDEIRAVMAKLVGLDPATAARPKGLDQYGRKQGTLEAVADDEPQRAAMAAEDEGIPAVPPATAAEEPAAPVPP